MRLFRHKSTLPRDPAVDAYVTSKPPAVRETAEALVTMIRRAVPDHTEIVYHGALRFCADRIPFAYVAAHKSHVNLGFFYGANLPDPDNLLLGEGKQMRHVKVLSPGEANRSRLRQLVKAAAADVLQRAPASRP